MNEGGAALSVGDQVDGYFVPMDPMVPTRRAVTLLRSAPEPAGVGPLLQCDSCR